ncbi:hypothetical protein HAX54_002180, partial [Datura stramonium]|nr:hypothetical protein [Datura stramonium]
NGEDDHRPLAGLVRQNAGSGKKCLQGRCLNPTSHRHFEDCDRWLADECLVETSLSSVLLTIRGSSTVRESPPAVRRSFAAMSISRDLSKRKAIAPSKTKGKGIRITF